MLDWRPIALCAGLVTALAPFAATSAHAQGAAPFPARPVRIVVPFPPGAINDLIARTVGQKLAAHWGQQVVVDNRPGGSSIIGSEIVAKAPGDGHTWLIVSPAHSTNPALFPKLPYDSDRDFAPITLIGRAPFMLVVHPSLPVKSVKDLVALARAKPGALAYGSGGNGNSTHLMGESLNRLAGVRILHVPYKGLIPAVNDVLAGQVHMTWGSYSTLGPFIRAGRLRALAVSTAQRSPATPEVPTVAEACCPGYEANSWWGFLLPAGTPQAMIERLHADVAAVMQQADVRERLFSQGVEAVVNTPAEFRDYLRAEAQRWARMVRDSGAKID